MLLLLVMGLTFQSAATRGGGRAAAAAFSSDSSRVALARAHPDTMRARVARLLARAAGAPSESAETDLSEAEALARAYAAAWADSFLIRRVERFRRWPPAERRVKAAADSLRLAGNDAFGSRGVAAAMRLWRRSADLCAQVADSAGLAMAWGNVGRGFSVQDQADSATVYYTRSLEYAERTGDFWTAGNAAGALASINEEQGNPRRAMELLQRSSALRARVGDDRGAAADENTRGNLAQSLGDLPAAREAYTRALEGNRRAGRRGPAATNLINLGNLFALTGDLDSAAACYREALGQFRAVGSRSDQAEALHDLGLLALRGGDYRLGVARFREALAIYRITGPAVSVAAVQQDLAEARAAMGDLQGALQELEHAEAGALTAGAGPAQRAGLALAQADLNA